MAAVAYLKRHPELEHAPIRVCFTVDEEVAGGPTISTSSASAPATPTRSTVPAGQIEAETFNASQDRHDPRRSTHPARPRQLVNAIKLAADLVAACRDALSPETTEEREASSIPRDLRRAEQALVEFIIRDHDAAR